MFGLMNLCTISLLVLAGALVLGEQLNSETKSNEPNKVDDIDGDIVKVEHSLDEVQNLLKLIEQDPEQKKQFAELGKHVTLIREQLQTIQEEYHMNKNVDQFNKRFGEWTEHFQSVGDRLTRDLKQLHQA